MGRPLNKKYFSTGPGNQIAIRAKIGTNAEGAGFIVKQVGSSRYIATVGANTGVVTLVDKANGALAAGEATITMVSGTGVSRRVRKMTSHRASFFGGAAGQWSFAATTDADTYQVADETDGFEATITITSQPANSTVTAPAAATFTVAATRSPATGTLAYQWQRSTNGGTSYTNITNGGVYSGATTATLSISDSTGLTGNRFRAVVSLTGADATPVNSTGAILTVNPA